MHSFLTRVALATDHGQDGVPRRKFGMIVNQRRNSSRKSANRKGSQFMRRSQMAPPSRIPSPGKGLSEISESQGNARSKMSKLPAAAGVKHRMNGPRK
jgi:hypothetical protein